MHKESTRRVSENMSSRHNGVKRDFLKEVMIELNGIKLDLTILLILNGCITSKPVEKCI